MGQIWFLMKKFLIVLLCFVLLIVSSCIYINYTWEQREKEYYSDKDVFVECQGTVTFINKTENMIYLAFDFDQSKNNFSDSSFKLNEVNSQIVIEAGFIREIRNGDTVNFISAPEYFGDGYVYPIVGLSTKDKVYLDFETGYNNLMPTSE